jgi:DNA-binding response OmpR family regulator
MARSDKVRSILIVDDEVGARESLKMILKHDYEVFLAKDAEEAFLQIKEHTPDLILLDIMMEPIDGWETLEQIKRNPETKDIPVLMLTAKQLSPEEAQTYGMYIEDYVLKPITHRELYDTIEHVLKRRNTIKLDVEEAKKAGFDQGIIDEYSRLAKSVDVNNRLLKILGEAKISIVGAPFLMRYNSPFTPWFLRRNEVGVEIRR